MYLVDLDTKNIFVGLILYGHYSVGNNIQLSYVVIVFMFINSILTYSVINIYIGFNFFSLLTFITRSIRTDIPAKDRTQKREYKKKSDGNIDECDKSEKYTEMN